MKDRSDRITGMKPTHLSQYLWVRNLCPLVLKGLSVYLSFQSLLCDHAATFPVLSLCKACSWLSMVWGSLLPKLILRVILCQLFSVNLHYISNTHLCVALWLLSSQVAHHFIFKYSQPLKLFMGSYPWGMMHILLLYSTGYFIQKKFNFSCCILSYMFQPHL